MDDNKIAHLKLVTKDDVKAQVQEDILAYLEEFVADYKEGKISELILFGFHAEKGPVGVFQNESPISLLGTVAFLQQLAMMEAMYGGEDIDD